MAEYYVVCGRPLDDAGNLCTTKTVPEVTMAGVTVLYCPTCRVNRPIPRRRACPQCRSLTEKTGFCAECAAKLGVDPDRVEIIE